MALTNHWKCQDNAANTQVANEVGVNGLLVGGDNTSTISVADGPGTAYPRSLDLDGTADAIDISGAAISFVSGTAFSLSTWFKADALSNAPLIGLDGITSDRILLNTTSVVVNLDTATTFTFTLVTGTWYHLLVTRDTSNNVRVFINAVESVTGAVVKAQTFAPDRIGRSTSYFNGKVADVRFWNEDKSADAAAIMAEKDAVVDSVSLLYAKMRR